MTWAGLRPAVDFDRLIILILVTGHQESGLENTRT